MEGAKKKEICKLHLLKILMIFMEFMEEMDVLFPV
jgi:hypothetical protein